jgi:hypothetical protein
MQILTTQPSGGDGLVAHRNVIAVQCSHQRHPKPFSKLHRCVSIRSEVRIDQARSACPQARDLRPRRTGIAKAELAQPARHAAAIHRPAGIFRQLDPRRPAPADEEGREPPHGCGLGHDESLGGRQQLDAENHDGSLFPGLVHGSRAPVLARLLSTSR